MQPWSQNMQVSRSASRHLSLVLLLALPLSLLWAPPGKPLFTGLSESLTAAPVRGALVAEVEGGTLGNREGNSQLLKPVRGVSTADIAGGSAEGRRNGSHSEKPLHGASAAEVEEGTGEVRGGGSQPGEPVRARNLRDGGAPSGPGVAKEARREAEILLRFKRDVTSDPNGGSGRFQCLSSSVSLLEIARELASSQLAPSWRFKHTAPPPCASPPFTPSLRSFYPVPLVPYSRGMGSPPAAPSFLRLSFLHPAPLLS